MTSLASVSYVRAGQATQRNRDESRPANTHSPLALGEAGAELPPHLIWIEGPTTSESDTSDTHSTRVECYGRELGKRAMVERLELGARALRRRRKHVLHPREHLVQVDGRRPTVSAVRSASCRPALLGSLLAGCPLGVFLLKLPPPP